LRLGGADRWALLVLSLLAGGGAARAAQPAPVALSWEAPDGCPTVDTVLGNVERILAEPGRPHAPVGAAAKVTVTAGDPWQATLILESGGTRTERRFQAESCDAAAAAAALILALAIEDRAAAEALAPPSFRGAAAAAELPADADVPPLRAPDGPTLADRPPPSPAAPGVHRRAQLLWTANGVVDWGTLPNSPSGGVEGSLGSRWSAGRWRLRALAGAAFFPTRELSWVAGVGYVYGDFWLMNIAGRACLGVTAARFEIGPCLGGELAVMHASSSENNPWEMATATHLWFSALGSAVASLRVTRSVTVSVRADAAVPTSRGTFGTSRTDSLVYQVPALAFRSAIGIEHSFE